ncbi:hypothetical protein LNQ03_28455 [Klebsiella pneumoniae subsp. pneumoniae]|nr:hypothetical protein [Klebsiella pneumoniae subsp. pneumoniae]
MSKNKSLPYLDPALCGLAEGAKILGDRWVLLILREAFYGVTRWKRCCRTPILPARRSPPG